jgi:hypothetical protein
MKPLAKFQDSFFKALFNNKAENVAPYLKDEKTAPKTLAQYQKSIFLSLKQDLTFIFPLTSAILGNIAFQKICLHFIRQNPPQQENVLFYGEKMSDYLKQIEVPFYVQDIATLEWAKYSLYYQKDEKPIRKEAFKAIELHQYPTLRFKLLSHAKFFRFHYDMRDIIENIHLKRPFSIKENPSYLLAIRPYYKVEIEWLDETEYELLIQFSHHECLETAYKNAIQKTKPFDLTQTLIHCLDRNYFLEIS